MSTEAQIDERAVHAAVSEIINHLLDFDSNTRRRILRTVQTFFSDAPAESAFRPVDQSTQTASTHGVRTTSFASSRELSPKDFLFQKQPQTDVERVACAAVSEIINHLLNFDSNTRRRILQTVQTFFPDAPAESAFRPVDQSTQTASTHGVRTTSFASSPELSPKDFLFQKQPQTDVERVACLAYYLTHYRDTPHFKTVDISLLNTEAAQVKFSNAAYAVVNAANAGLLVPAGKGAKQLSAHGERYVEALPDRATAKEVLMSMRTRRGRKAARNNKPSEN